MNSARDPHGVTIGHKHYSHRSPGLRAALLGANDGLVSISAIVMGVIGANVADRFLLLSALAALTGGTLSMALGEYVSVSVQSDSEKADIQKEIEEHAKGPEFQQRELEELAGIYEAKGLDPELAMTVAQELSKGDVIRVHMQDELGIDVDNLSSPIQACIFSGLSFLFGGAIPLIAMIFQQKLIRIIVIIVIDLILFFLFAVVSSKLAGSPKIFKACFRLVFGGFLALSCTFLTGYLFTIL